MPLTQTRWPTFAALVAGVTIIALFWYFVLANPTGEAVPASGGRYIEGVTRAPERINPLFATANTVDQDLASLIFSGLVRLGPDGTPLPDLAERWEITGNGQNYVFYLRRGVAWHGEENTPFDAEDVVFTFRAIADPAFKGDPALAQLMQGVVVTARDAYTVEFRLEQAFSPFLAYMTVGILPQHLLAELDANQLYNSEFNARPIGTGPYRLQDRTEDSVVLASNGTYYYGPPRISTLEFRVFSDASALIAALRQGEVHGALLGPGTPDADLDFLSSMRAYVMQELSATSVHVIYFDRESELFADDDVRRALMLGLNRAALVEEVAGGRGSPSIAAIPAGSWAAVDGDAPEFSPGAAASALERAGWARGADGVRRKGATRLSFALSTSNDPVRIAIAENVARQWSAIGVEANVQVLEASTYIDEHLLARQFQAALVEIDPGPDPDPYPFWHSSQIAPPGRNLADYSDARMDDALQRARHTTDIERRRELYEDYQRSIVEDVPALPLYSPVYTYAQSGGVQGFSESLLFSPASRFATIGDWYMRTRVE